MYARACYYDSSTCHIWGVTRTHENTTMNPVHATHGEWHVCKSTLLWLQYMPPTASDMYAQASYYDSSTCHLWGVTRTHENTTMNPIHATHDEWHVCKSTLLWLQYMPPTTSDMYTQAHYYDSNTCHPRWVTCMHEHTTTTPVHATHNEWHVRTSTPRWLQYMPPTTSDIYARAHHHDSSICHPRWVTYMLEHTTMTLVYVTHGEWHICKSIPLCLQRMSPTTSGMYARTRRPKPKLNNSLVDPIKGLQNPRFALGESYRFTPPCLQYVSLCKMHICKSTSLCL